MLEERAVVAQLSAEGSTLCAHTKRGEIERWDVANARRVDTRSTSGLQQLVALAGQCIVLDEKGRVVIGDEVVAAIPPFTVIGAAGDGWIGGRGIAIDHYAGGIKRKSWPGMTGVTAMAMNGSVRMLGFADGTVEIHDDTRAVRFERAPTSAVLRLMPGPAKTTLAGYANGAVMLWDPAGRRLAEGRLHGRVIHLRVTGTTVVAATDLGSMLRWDLALLDADYCELLREVWRDVPVTWEDGRSVLRAAVHRCQG
jgi:hypothetical protein